MIDGTYKIAVDVPFGRKEGTVVLRTEGDTVIADIDAPVIGQQRVEGHAEGDTFSAQGTGKLRIVGRIEYSLTGSVTGDDLHIDIDSSKGQFALDGVRI